MAIFLTVIHIIACFMLILVILLQAGRGHGLTNASFGSGNVQSLLGTRAGDFLTKATTVAAIAFLVTCISLDILEAQRSRSLLRGPNSRPPLDLDQIKKALEKIKAEAPAKDAVKAAADQVKPISENLAASAAPGVSGAVKTVEKGNVVVQVKEAVEAKPAVVNDAAPNSALVPKAEAH